MEQYFTKDTFRFLTELKRNNNRDWFQENKPRFESHVKQPFLKFIADFAPHLHKINPRLKADPKPTGGSLFRIYRDIRFSEDKSPYKTHAGANFPHIKGGKEVHVPGYYFHLEPGSCFAAAGVWHPDPKTLGKIRSAILGKPEEWKKISRKIKIEGDTLVRPPKGFPADHPLIQDLKRKDFVSSVMFRDSDVTSPDFLSNFTQACKSMSPLVAFLSKALGLPW